MTNQNAHTDDLRSCTKWVASNVWVAAWRTANNDADPDPATERQVDILINETDFIDLALYRHNWRNIHAVLAAFHDAGTMGSADVLDFYEHVNRIPKDQRQPAHPDPRKRPAR